LNQDSDHGFICPLCEDAGMSVQVNGKHNVARFCPCAIGQRRKRLYGQYQERVKLEAKSYQQRRERKFKRLVHDYKTKAAGELEPGEEG